MEQLRLGLEWFLNPDHLPLLVGQERGWFEAAGIGLELIEPAEHFDAMEAIHGGRMEVAITEPVHLVSDSARGGSLVGFTRFLHTNGGVMYLRGRGIERPRDMAGKRIQYPGAPGPGGVAIVKTMIEADGGQCDPSAFTRVNNGFYHTDALLEDKADLATLVFYNFEIIEARHRGADPGMFALKDWGVPDFCQLVLVTSAEMLSHRRPLLARFLSVLRQGIDLLHQAPREARSTYEHRAGVDPDDVLGAATLEATLPCFTYDFSMATDYYTKLQAWMLSTGQIDRGLDPAEYWTNELAY